MVETLMMLAPTRKWGKANRMRFHGIPSRFAADSRMVSVSVPPSSASRARSSAVKGIRNSGCFAPAEPALLMRTSISPHAPAMVSSDICICSKLVGVRMTGRMLSAEKPSATSSALNCFRRVESTAGNGHFRAFPQVHPGDDTADTTGRAGDEGRLFRSDA
jgi:hypothetical protein